MTAGRDVRNLHESALPFVARAKAERLDTLNAIKSACALKFIDRPNGFKMASVNAGQPLQRNAGAAAHYHSR